VLKKYDILLVVDEVMTGFDRLGSMFGSDHYGLEADMITIAKGLTSAYAPLSGSIIGERMWKVLEQGTDENDPIGHGWSYLNTAINDALSDHPHVCEIRGEGMLCAVEFVKNKDNHIFFDPADKIGPQVSAALFAQDKVIARAMPQGDILGFVPPFCLTRQEADTVVAATVRAVKTILG
jgi:L-2,4-diaminobutyrate transaminase